MLPSLSPPRIRTRQARCSLLLLPNSAMFLPQLPSLQKSLPWAICLRLPSSSSLWSILLFLISYHQHLHLIASSSWPKRVCVLPHLTTPVHTSVHAPPSHPNQTHYRCSLAFSKTTPVHTFSPPLQSRPVCAVLVFSSPCFSLLSILSVPRQTVNKRPINQ